MLKVNGAPSFGGNFPANELIVPNAPTTLHVDTYINSTKDSSNNIYISYEPQAIYKLQHYILSNWNSYKYILTYNEALLHLPNARKYLVGTTWIEKSDAESIDVNEKKFQMSSITGNKRITAGHNFRIDVYIHQNDLADLRIPCVWYLSGSPPVGGKSSNKIALFKNFQFSLVIENSRQNNYFTEKLCDCLYTKTIPIYYGCPNIHEYFDTTGWIIINSESVDELKEKMAILNDTHFSKHLDTVEKNYIEVQKYLSFTKNINNALEKCEDY